MSSNSEGGHAKVVANFEGLVNVVIGYGDTTYNPAKNSIKRNALTLLLVNAQTALWNVKEAKTFYDTNCNLREIAFSTLRQFCTRIFNLLAATDASEQTLNDARTILNKIYGKRAGKIEAVAEGEEAPATSSVSRQSYDLLVDHYDQLVVIVMSEPTYTPNEPEFAVAGLQATLLDLRTKNTNVISSGVALKNTRDERDRVLYAPNTGVRDVALAVKAYAKGLFGPTTVQYKNLSGIAV